MACTKHFSERNFRTKFDLIDTADRTRDRGRVGQERRLEIRHLIEPDRPYLTGHAASCESGLQQAHADAVELGPVGPDDAAAVMEADIPDRCLADIAVSVDKQGIVEPGLLCAPPIVEKWKCTHMLDCRQVALIAE